jgi:hypothetical protein
MENSELPDPDVVFPVPNIKTVTYIKPKRREIRRKLSGKDLMMN